MNEVDIRQKSTKSHQIQPQYFKFSNLLKVLFHLCLTCWKECGLFFFGGEVYFSMFGFRNGLREIRSVPGGIPYQSSLLFSAHQAGSFGLLWKNDAAKADCCVRYS